MFFVIHLRENKMEHTLFLNRKPDVWFDGVDPSLLELSTSKSTAVPKSKDAPDDSVTSSKEHNDVTSKALVKENSSKRCKH